MNTDAASFRSAVLDINARVEWNENIACSCHDDVELGVAQFAAESGRDIEGHHFFGRTGSTISAAVATAVPGIDDNAGKGVAGILQLRLRRNGFATCQKKHTKRDAFTPPRTRHCD